MERATKRVIEIDTDYDITVAPDKQMTPIFLNLIAKPMAEHLAADSRFELMPESGDYILIYHRKR